MSWTSPSNEWESCTLSLSCPVTLHGFLQCESEVEEEKEKNTCDKILLQVLSSLCGGILTETTGCSVPVLYKEMHAKTTLRAPTLTTGERERGGEVTLPDPSATCQWAVPNHVFEQILYNDHHTRERRADLSLIWGFLSALFKKPCQRQDQG